MGGRCASLPDATSSHFETPVTLAQCFTQVFLQSSISGHFIITKLLFFIYDIKAKSLGLIFTIYKIIFNL